MRKTAIVLFNLGGPDKSDSVKPFLFNLFNDKAIINLPQPLRFLLAKIIANKRASKAQKIYAQINNKSPLLSISLSQAHALECELSFFGNFKVFIAMRYWHPFVSSAVKEIEKYKPDQVILLPLYPQFSSATTNSSLEDFSRNFNKKIPVKTICCYPVEPDFIKSHALLIKQTIARFYDNNLDQFRFLFSAHGLPQKLINAGDPYVFQIAKTTEEIIKSLRATPNQKIDFQICYQSKVGPLQWTSPSLEYALKRAALDKKKSVVIIPISFVSEHSETLVELDVEYRNLAKQLGIKNYLRVPALNVEGHFIKGLAGICRSVSANDEVKIFCGKDSQRICPGNFKLCPNHDHR